MTRSSFYATTPCACGIIRFADRGTFMGTRTAASPTTPAALSMDVGVDTHEFLPWHSDEIKERMEEKAPRLKRPEPPPCNTSG